MDFKVRNAVRTDCAAMMELVRELARFERAPDAVTVSLSHFEESGFGEKPVWWGFVAVASDRDEQQVTAGSEASITSQIGILNPSPEDVQGNPSLEPVPATVMLNPSASDPSNEQILKPEEIFPVMPESLEIAVEAYQASRETIIGFALYYVRYSTWKGQRMYLEDLLVTENSRGKGVGTALMDALIGRAIADNLHGITWQVLNWNEPAINFYKRYSARMDGEWLNASINV